MEAMRVDKWLWTVRLYKTRSMAAEACKAGKIAIAGISVKPSREVKAGDEIEVRQQSIRKKIKILKLVNNRVSAKFVPELMADLTPEHEYERLEILKQLKHEKRDRGTGRPTKKERRDIDRLKDF